MCQRTTSTRGIHAVQEGCRARNGTIQVGRFQQRARIIRDSVRGAKEYYLYFMDSRRAESSVIRVVCGWEGSRAYRVKLMGQRCFRVSILFLTMKCTCKYS